MTKPLNEIKCFLLDMDGTIYLGDHLLPGALDFLETLNAQGKKFMFLTNNSSKNPAQYVEKLARLGIDTTVDQVFTSGQATAIYLEQKSPGAKVYLVGTPGLEDEFRSHGFILTEDDPGYVVLGFDTTLTYEKLWKLCDFVRDGKPYIGTHPDDNCPTLTGFMPDIGAMMALVEVSTGRRPDVIVGKPNKFIVESAAAKVGVAVEEIAMIGDRLYTDIALGSTAGITTLLVLSGETKASDVPDSPHKPAYIFENIGEVSEWLKTNIRLGDE
ncbi:MAG: HAD-IIA family hydrolase [Anaerolineaceae bacterium]|nr:HAD-IIA family hydrolase [Anaerolineaceae bacterium]